MNLRINRLRLLGAWAGLLLWFAYPFVEWQGGIDAFRYSCRFKPVIDGRDPCFTDYIPVLEMIAFVLTIALGYWAIRFSFTLYSLPSDQRGRGWRLAGRSGGSGYSHRCKSLAGSAFSGLACTPRIIRPRFTHTIFIGGHG